jgi:hypothetical protein
MATDDVPGPVDFVLIEFSRARSRAANFPVRSTNTWHWHDGLTTRPNAVKYPSGHCRASAVA